MRVHLYSLHGRRNVGRAASTDGFPGTDRDGNCIHPASITAHTHLLIADKRHDRVSKIYSTDGVRLVFSCHRAAIMGFRLVLNFQAR